MTCAAFSMKLQVNVLHLYYMAWAFTIHCRATSMSPIAMFNHQRQLRYVDKQHAIQCSVARTCTKGCPMMCQFTTSAHVWWCCFA
jgi:hypothetical protein